MCFFLEVDSNDSLSYFENNSNSSFHTKLPAKLHGEHYKVCLKKIQFQINKYTFNNEEDRTVLVYANEKEHKFLISNERYTSVNELIDSIREEISEIADDISIHLDEYDKVVIKTNESIIKFSSAICAVLGLINPTIYGLYTRSKIGASLQNLKSSVYVEVDCIKNQLVGAKNKQYLDVLYIDNTNTNCVYKSDFPVYIDLLPHQFDSLKFNLTSKNGKPVDFLTGSTKLLLHFKLKK